MLRTNSKFMRPRNFCRMLAGLGLEANVVLQMGLLSLSESAAFIKQNQAENFIRLPEGLVNRDD